MASFSVPCPKVSVLSVASSSHSSQTHQPHVSVSFRSGPALVPRIQGGSSWVQSQVFKVNAKLNEVAIDQSNNSTPVSEESLEEVSKTEYSIPDASSIQAFMSQAADLVQLVDSRDIVELQLKQNDCEILIRKKAALPQPPVVMAPPSAPQAYVQQQLPPASAPAPAAPAALALPPPAPSKPKSSHPPMKCPMAGTFYRSPAPGAPPFVKVGDKVQKGQLVCIIEAMKLMNEIEADQAGTIVEIIAEDGKPVSVDTPLFVIEP
ncbi:Biotin carboxyl carrier protein of acetyl-CoA carboxylase, chloroplastic [Capsicum annuum]|uniref:Biotin carboxyl carrier protein of acetyl-CoA carboxylase n=1 Tax=Capsicum annuum TaxID=4072 RepID=A0A1U8FI08_CAPAN|nr:biotin carboxyl carrier protein of acetyl-CoA carboxylase 1, chloroplastic [Capsicum annuum]KAF3624512.1 Biotin carboxyl carrier protein of acetyl-CoA carboxylase, chloroplastic [Capsicum annuum]PHT79599.1 Biotin carboxyl carrier protein of acetyl-CoA carboxylase, chloroplastic [Capsicum annuum]